MSEETMEAAGAVKNRFRPVLIEAAEKAFKEGRIDRGQLRTIRFGSLIPSMARAMEQAVVEDAVSLGVLPVGANDDRAGIDFKTLFALIMEWLPKLLQLLSIFSQ